MKSFNYINVLFFFGLIVNLVLGISYNVDSAISEGEDGDWRLEGVDPANLMETSVSYLLPDGKNATGTMITPIDQTNLSDWMIMIIPDWDGAGNFEFQQGARVASMGHTAFITDLYGSGQPQGENANLSFPEKIQLSTNLRKDIKQHQGGISNAIAAAHQVPGNENKIVALYGFCLGGIGTIEYFRLPSNDIANDNVKLGVAFHPGQTNSAGDISFDSSAPTNKENYTSTLVIAQGTADEAALVWDEVGELTRTLNEANLWLSSEQSFYTAAKHGFTRPGESYDMQADKASWDRAIALLNE